MIWKHFIRNGQEIFHSKSDLFLMVCLFYFILFLFLLLCVAVNKWNMGPVRLV